MPVENSSSSVAASQNQIKLFFAIEFIAICQNVHTEFSISLIFICSDWSNPKMSCQIFSLPQNCHKLFIDTATVQPAKILFQLRRKV